MDLHNYREQIDEIDDQLLILFMERMDVARQIALYKKKYGLSTLDAAREREKLSYIGKKAGEELSPYAHKLYNVLFQLSRAYQESTINAGDAHPGAPLEIRNSEFGIRN